MTLLQQLDPNVQKKAQEKLTNEMKAWAETNAKKNAELAELRKIKVDSAVVKYLVAEFGVPQAEVELSLRQNDNDLDKVMDLLVNAKC